MRYMLLMWDDETEALSPEQIAALPEMTTWLKDVEARGVSHQGVRLRPAAQARTVRIRNGELLVTDGPFAETKDQMAGFELIDCTDLDEAIEVAAGHPTAARFSIEIRPFWQG
jgi:hypothetical protein